MTRDVSSLVFIGRAGVFCMSVLLTIVNNGLTTYMDLRGRSACDALRFTAEEEMLEAPKMSP